MAFLCHLVCCCRELGEAVAVRDEPLAPADGAMQEEKLLSYGPTIHIPADGQLCFARYGLGLVPGSVLQVCSGTVGGQQSGCDHYMRLGVPFIDREYRYLPLSVLRAATPTTAPSPGARRPLSATASSSATWRPGPTAASSSAPVPTWTSGEAARPKPAMMGMGAQPTS